MSKVSIIVPIYNVEKYLRKCLESLTSQTYADIEIICVNDGSKDNSLSIINEFKDKDSRIIVINQRNLGLSGARNSGLKAATGEYISFVDSDDWVDQNYIQILVEELERNSADIACSTIVREKKNKSVYRIFYDKTEVYESLDDKIKACKIPDCCYVWNKLYKKDLIGEQTFRQGANFEDVLFLPELVKKSTRLVSVCGTSYHYRQNSSSIIASKPSYKKMCDAYRSKKYIVKFFKDNNLNLPNSEKNISKYVKYVFSIPVLKVKECDGLERFYLFAFFKVPKFVLTLIEMIQAWCCRIFLVSVIDGHKVIFFFGFHIRIKNKQKIPETLISEVGVTEIKRSPRIIASLTSFPQRIGIVDKTIKTILDQKLKPDEVILWLADSQFEDRENSLPPQLLELKNYGLTIKWCEDLKSYKKLIPALREYPDDIIITFDDDIYYPRNTIEDLYNAYLDDKSCICANRCWRIGKSGKKLKVLPAFNLYYMRYRDLSFRNSIIGCGGVLYPPNSLNPEVLNVEKFMSIIPTQDDIWFWAMAVLNNTPIKVVNSYDIALITVEKSQQCGLCKINKSGQRGIGGKDSFNLIVEHYPEILEKI